ncbi:MAG: MBL fold metallo-hydrolase [bacterium]
MRVTVLGCGTSTGVPVIGCPCDVCRSTDPRNHRSRSSIVVSENGQNVLVDTAPELRYQALATGITTVDAVLYTHDHADHIFGMDELRTFNFIMGRSIPVYGNEKVINRIRNVFDYIWDPSAPQGGGLPMITTTLMDGDLEVADMRIRPLSLWHGRQIILGFKFGETLAYMTDCSQVPEETMEEVRGTPVIIIDALRYRPHTTHFSVDQALEVIKELSPERAYLTHLSHSLDYNRLRSELPDGVEPAYDGLEVNLEGTGGS